MHRKRKSITELARDLQNNPTESEKILWEMLRKRRLEGYRFVRQKPFIYEEKQNKKYFFIADFYCAEKKLIIESDGKIHDHQKYYDEQRDKILFENQLHTLRIKNEELQDLNLVREKILNFIKKV